MKKGYTIEETLPPVTMEMFLKFLEENFGVLEDNVYFKSLREFLQNDFDNQVAHINVHPKKRSKGLREKTLNRFIQLLIQGTPNYLKNTDWYIEKQEVLINKIIEINEKCTTKLNFNEILDDTVWNLNQDQRDRFITFKNILNTRKSIGFVFSNTINSNSSRTRTRKYNFEEPKPVFRNKRESKIKSPKKVSSKVKEQVKEQVSKKSGVSKSEKTPLQVSPEPVSELVPQLVKASQLPYSGQSPATLNRFYGSESERAPKLVPMSTYFTPVSSSFPVQFLVPQQQQPKYESRLGQATFQSAHIPSLKFSAQQNSEAKQYNNVEVGISKVEDNGSLSSVSLGSQKLNNINKTQIYPISTHDGDQFSEKLSSKNSKEPNSTKVEYYNYKKENKRSDKVLEATMKVHEYEKKLSKWKAILKKELESETEFSSDSETEY